MDLVAVQQVADTLLKSKMDGVIATNTTLDRSLVQGQRFADEAGGLSGLPVRDKSTQVLTQLRQAVGAKLPIIGVGGISDAASAQEKLAAGANLLQIYTGFIYRGPQLIKEIVDSL